MQYVGYIIDEEEKGVVVAAGADHDEVFTNTFMRLCEVYGGDFRFCQAQLSVQEKDITPEDAASINQVVAAHFDKNPPAIKLHP